MKIDDLTILGIFIHLGHIFSEYKERDIAYFARGITMGITMAVEMALQKNSNDLLPDVPLRSEFIDFGLHHFLRSFYFTEFIDRKSIRDSTEKLNQYDLSSIKEKVKKEMLEFAGSSSAFFIDPKTTKKQ